MREARDPYAAAPRWDTAYGSPPSRGRQQWLPSRTFSRSTTPPPSLPGLTRQSMMKRHTGWTYGFAALTLIMDARVKPGHDEVRGVALCPPLSSGASERSERDLGSSNPVVVMRIDRGYWIPAFARTTAMAAPTNIFSQHDPSTVIAGLDPAIHDGAQHGIDLRPCRADSHHGARVKPGHDAVRVAERDQTRKANTPFGPRSRRRSARPISPAPACRPSRSRDRSSGRR